MGRVGLKFPITLYCLVYGSNDRDRSLWSFLCKFLDQTVLRGMAWGIDNEFYRGLILFLELRYSHAPTLHRIYALLLLFFLPSALQLDMQHLDFLVWNGPCCFCILVLGMISPYRNFSQCYSQGTSLLWGTFTTSGLKWTELKWLGWTKPAFLPINGEMLWENINCWFCIIIRCAHRNPQMQYTGKYQQGPRGHSVIA